MAEIYETETKRLNEAVRRNPKRFPSDFCFQLTEKEADILRSQIAISSSNHGGRRYLPYGFTREGANMLSAVLHTDIQKQQALETGMSVDRKVLSRPA